VVGLRKTHNNYYVSSRTTLKPSSCIATLPDEPAAGAAAEAAAGLRADSGNRHYEAERESSHTQAMIHRDLFVKVFRNKGTYR
jgi:hypothetical protein